MDKNSSQNHRILRLTSGSGAMIADKGEKFMGLRRSRFGCHDAENGRHHGFDEAPGEWKSDPGLNADSKGGDRRPCAWS